MSEKKTGRLESLDILRGFDMFFIFLPDPVPCVVFTALAALGLGGTAFAAQFEHCAWNGLRFYDCIFPLFLFISGVTFPFSYAAQRARGATTAQIVRKILKRAFILVLMGSMLWTVIDGTLEKNLLAFEWDTFRVWSVIGRIGIAWGAAALLYMAFGRRTRIGIVVAILLGMWAVMRFAVAPGTPAGVNPMITGRELWVNWLDINYLTTAHRPEGGFVTITQVATAMFGVFAGEILQSALTPMRKLRRLIDLAVLLSVSGFLMANVFGSWSLPINKSVWTSSFALMAGGISTMLLALFYWIVDIRGWRRWGFFFKVIGMNAITIYLLMRTVFNWQFESQYFFGGICRYLSPEWGALVSQVGMIAIGWLFLLYLYRKGVFLRV